MNYYPFHIGDYASDTAHLEPMEDLAYRRMLDKYYAREAPFPPDISEIARLVRMRSNVSEVEAVLREFFELGSDGWRHTRCDTEIAKMQDKQIKAQASAQASVNARRASAERTLNGRLADVELPTPTPTPTPNRESAGEIAPAPDGLRPPCQTKDIVDLYHTVLPELPQVRLMSEQRQAAISKMWKWVFTSKRGNGEPRARTNDEAVEWFRQYFEMARDNDFVMGRSQRSPGHENWRCDLDYLLTDKGKVQVIEKTGGKT